MQTIEYTLQSGNPINPDSSTYFCFANERELLAELPSPQHAELIKGYSLRWLAEYSETFPEVGLLHLLGGGDASDLLPYYKQSACLDFRKRCLLAFCLNNIPVEHEAPEFINEFWVDVDAELSAEREGEAINFKLTLANDGREVCVLFSDKALNANMKISRCDGVPVYYAGILLFPHPDKDAQKAVRAAQEKYTIDMTCIQPDSKIVRRATAKIRKVSVSRSATIEDVYLKQYGTWYSLFGHYVSGELEAPLELEIRYVYDSRILNDYLRSQGYLRFGAGEPTLNFRIESNPVRLVIGPDGKLLEVSTGG